MRRPTHARKLLTSKVGLATLVLASTTAFPGCNLLPPPPCDDAGGRGCRPETTDASSDAPSNVDVVESPDV